MGRPCPSGLDLTFLRKRTWGLAVLLAAAWSADASAHMGLSACRSSADCRSDRASGAARFFRSGTVQILLIGSGLTALALTADRSAQRDFRRKEWLEPGGFDIGDDYGDGLTVSAVALGAWSAGAVLKNHGLSQTGTDLVKGVALDFAAVTLLKEIIRRPRPDSSDRRSFPSGHTSGAFTMSTILARHYGWKVGIPAYLLATATAFARIEDNKHRLSDVVAGATIGIVMGRLVTPARNHIRGHSVEFVAGPKSVAVRLEF